MESSNSKSERYAELSRRFIEKANEYLRAGDRVQARKRGRAQLPKPSNPLPGSATTGGGSPLSCYCWHCPILLH